MKNWVDCSENNKAVFAMNNLNTRSHMHIIDQKHYQNIIDFINDWQKENKIPDYKESNKKFKVDFIEFFQKSDIPKEIQQEFLKDI